MKGKPPFRAIVAALGIALGSSGVIGFVFGGKMVYKLGQIDALNGEVQYELVEQDNGETTWQEIR